MRGNMVKKEVKDKIENCPKNDHVTPITQAREENF
jgi:hypothetical protein